LHAELQAQGVRFVNANYQVDGVHTVACRTASSGCQVLAQTHCSSDERTGSFGLKATSSNDHDVEPTWSIGFQSITENIDTTTSGGKLIFHVFGALAEFERDLIRERTQAGLQAARARGRFGGRPKALDQKKAAIAQALYNDKSNRIADICKTLHISQATLYRHMKTK
jgi:hypothetical protein